MNKYAAIILNYNSCNETLAEIELFRKLKMAEEFDIIVVDNSSPNGDYQILKDKQDGYQLLSSEKNGGYAAGNNIGLKYCLEHSYQYVLILNNDILFPCEDVLEKLVEIIRKNPDIAVINPDIISPSGYLFNRDSVRPSFFDLTLGMLSYKKRGRKVTDLGGYSYVYRPHGCCMLLDLQKMGEVGLFDENTFLYSEELILAERFLKCGYKCACCTSVQAVHNHSNIVKSNISKKKTNKIKTESFKYYLKTYRRFSAIKTWICLCFYRIKLKFLN